MEIIKFIEEITRAMGRNDDPKMVLNQILSACIELTGAHSGSIMILDKQKKYLEIQAEQGLLPTTAALRLQVGEGVTGWVAKHERPRIVGDASKESDYITVKENLSSELAVPMFVRDEIFGVLSVDSHNKNAFTSQHEHYLSIMSNLAAHIFRNLDDNRLLKIRDRFHRVMIKISRVISRSLELEDIFREIMEITESSFRLFGSTLLLYDPKTDSLKVFATVGTNRKEIQNIIYKPGEGITGTVFTNKSPIFIPSVKEEPEFLNRMNLIEDEAGNIGFFCCPIFSGTDVVGVFSTYTHHQSGFEPEFLIEFLEIIGSFISQAITIQKLIKEETKIIQSENLQLKQQLGARHQFGNLIGGSSAMKQLFEKVRVVADSRANILITGESGTGKELIASAIHYNSPRRENPFIKINCAAIPENLLESELFGHRKGAFTGAIADKKGKFELAHTGTIFLDEIGELDMNLQSKLLRVLQEREIEPVGGNMRKVDIRIIAATNANLEEKIDDGSFRSDLYYRLNVINIHIPPLRERKDDILHLSHNFIEKFKNEYGKKIDGISPDAIMLLESYDWPGNVRELENILERTIVLSQNKYLMPDDFCSVAPQLESGDVGSEITARQPVPEKIMPGNSDLQLPPDSQIKNIEGGVYRYIISEVERKLIEKVLQKFHYKKTKTANYLGINRNTLDKKIKELDIDY